MYRKVLSLFDDGPISELIIVNDEFSFSVLSQSSAWSASWIVDIATKQNALSDISTLRNPNHNLRIRKKYFSHRPTDLEFQLGVVDCNVVDCAPREHVEHRIAHRHNRAPMLPPPLQWQDGQFREELVRTWTSINAHSKCQLICESVCY